MRRHLAIFIMVVYGVLSVGIHLHMHYCCGQLADISIFDHDACNHHEENSGECCKKSTGCCSFEDITLKLNDSHNATYFKIFVSGPAEMVPVEPFQPIAISSQNDHQIYADAPNIPLGIPIYLKHHSLVLYA